MFAEQTFKLTLAVVAASVKAHMRCSKTEAMPQAPQAGEAAKA